MDVRIGCVQYKRVPHSSLFFAGKRHAIQIPCEDILRTCEHDASITVRYLKQFHDARLSNRLDLSGFTIGVMPDEVKPNSAQPAGSKYCKLILLSEGHSLMVACQMRDSFVSRLQV